MTSFHYVLLFQFHEDWRNLFQMFKERNIVHHMVGGSTVQYNVQTGLWTVRSLEELVIYQQAVDTFRLLWEILFEVVFLNVCVPCPLLLNAPVRLIRVTVLPIGALASASLQQSGPIELT